MYKKITSSSNSIIKNILSLSNNDNMFFVFGKKIINELLKFNFIFKNILVLESKIDLLPTHLIQKYSKHIILISKEIALKLCKNRKEWIFGLIYKKKDPLNINYKKGVLLDNIQHPENVGFLIRTALGLGIDHIFLLNSVNKYNAKLISSSASYCLSDKVSQIKSIKEINIYNKFIISTSLASNSKDIRNINKKQIGDNWIIIFGNEGNGISQEILKLSNLQVKINMKNNIDSLNVSVSAIILLWEILNKN